jgi:7-cyano-7-deazaguanine synthase
MGQRTAIVLLSGGLDSATTLALALERGFEVIALTFRYGQRHAIEIDAARLLCRHFAVNRHIVIEIDASVFGGAVLTGGDQRYGSDATPATYVPARNTLFLAYSFALAESVGCRDVFLGPNADDAAGYPDCREPYLRAIERVSELGTAMGGVEIHAPLVGLSKVQVLDLALAIGVPTELTWSCYFPVDGQVCGECDACRLRSGARIS